MHMHSTKVFTRLYIGTTAVFRILQMLMIVEGSFMQQAYIVHKVVLHYY